jgi:hypothetical protein
VKPRLAAAQERCPSWGDSHVTIAADLRERAVTAALVAP